MRLHKEHGVNPTIPVCAFCGEGRNEVVLLGSAYKDRAPMHMLCDYEPCDNCKQAMARGVALIEVVKQPVQPGQPPIEKNNPMAGADLYPTGRWLVVTEECILHTINPNKLAREIVKRGKTFIDRDAFEPFLKRAELDGVAE